jgi:ABC-type multidrug transport system fused ATPase/permease subunit
MKLPAGKLMNRPFAAVFASNTNIMTSVDSHVDELVQRVIRERFENRTVIAIVHKLQSALEDFDMVAVLDKGELLEFGPPRQLLEEGPENSAFAALYKSLDTGDKEAPQG